MEALQRLKELSFGHREKIRKVQKSSESSSSGSWLRRLKETISNQCFETKSILKTRRYGNLA